MSADRLVLQRDPIKEGHPTTGRLDLLMGAKRHALCRTLELPWRDNQRGVSCIPAGTFRMVYAPSPRLGGMRWRLMGVPKRDGILIHTANFISQLRGCIAPGVTLADIDGDGLIDSVSSKVAMAKVDEALAIYQPVGIDIHVLNSASRA